jgi:hypothetical protein
MEKRTATLTDNPTAITDRVSVKLLEAADNRNWKYVEELLRDGAIHKFSEGWGEGIEPEVRVTDVVEARKRHGWLGVGGLLVDKLQRFYALVPRKQNPVVRAFILWGLDEATNVLARAGKLFGIKRCGIDEKKNPDGIHGYVTMDPRRLGCADPGCADCYKAARDNRRNKQKREKRRKLRASKFDNSQRVSF